MARFCCATSFRASPMNDCRAVDKRQSVEDLSANVISQTANVNKKDY